MIFVKTGFIQHQNPAACGPGNWYETCLRTLTFSLGNSNKEKEMSRQITARPEDVCSPDAIISTMYEAISGTSGERDWDRIRSLYLDGARLIPTGARANGEDGFRLMDIEGWIEGARPFFEQGAFYEVEIARKTESFGNVCHAFSTYECRTSPDQESAYMTGINSIQLLNKDGRWWVVTVFWDNGTAVKPVPEKYLG